MMEPASPATPADPPAPMPLLVLAGPTATGKTGLAIALARRLGGEIVSADSRQIYRGMDIGTAKPTPEQRALVPHHLLDVVAPDESYTLAQYQADAQAAIAAIHARGLPPSGERLPLLVGGTGLYLRAVVDNLAIPQVPPNQELRQQLEEEATHQGSAALHARLATLDPIGAARIDPANLRRVIRALEVVLLTGRPFSAQQGARPSPYRPLFLGLNGPREVLYARADQRVDAMLAAGLVEEVQRLITAGYDWRLPSMSSLGYQEIGSFLRGEMSLEAAVERLKFDTHHYIRRQLTWFRAEGRIRWLDCTADDLESQALALAEAWLAG